MTDESRCPVCAEEFGNPGALGTHLSLTKDASHVAHRAGAEGASPAMPAQAVASPEAPPASPVLLPASPEQAETPALPAYPNGYAAFGEAGEAGTQGEARRGEATQAGEAIGVFSLPAPTSVEPLLPPSDGPGQAGDRPKPPPVQVPLEPILAGTTAAALNALFLARPTDGQLTPDSVRGTGFPKAAEACVRLYFPDLPLDHPAAALILSSASLAILVVSLRGANAPKEPEAPKPATQQATVTQAPILAEAERPASASTGDAYWDAILSKAGGVQV